MINHSKRITQKELTGQRSNEFEEELEKCEDISYSISTGEKAL